MSEQNKESWHLDKRIGVSHIVTTLAIAISAFSYIQKLEVKIELMEQRLEIEIARSEKLDASLEARLEALRVEGKTERRQLGLEIKGYLNGINSKLDKVIERGR